jgi:hypothetical protein
MAENGPMAHVWKEKLPQLGLAHNFLLSLLLSLSALHLARQQPKRRDSLMSLAERHANAGLRGNTIALASLTAEKSQAVYMSAVLACYIHLARGPTSDDCLLFRISGDGIADWWTLFRGIRTLHEVFGSSVGFGVYWNEARQDQEPEIQSDGEKAFIFSPSGWCEALEALQDHISSSPNDNPGGMLCQAAMESLVQIYKDEFGGDNKEVLPPFAWLFRLDGAFIQQLRQLNSVPLVLLAYFAVALIHLEKNWYLKDWPGQIIHTVQKYVLAEHQKWLQWPLMQWAQSRTTISAAQASPCSAVLNDNV